MEEARGSETAAAGETVRSAPEPGCLKALPTLPELLLFQLTWLICVKPWSLNLTPYFYFLNFS